MYDERNDLDASLYVLKNPSTSFWSPSITDIEVLLSSNAPLQIIFPLTFQSSMIVAIVPAAAAFLPAVARDNLQKGSNKRTGILFFGDEEAHARTRHP